MQTHHVKRSVSQNLVNCGCTTTTATTTTSLLHPFNGLFSRTTWVSRYQKVKTSLDLNEARDDGPLHITTVARTGRRIEHLLLTKVSDRDRNVKVNKVWLWLIWYSYKCFTNLKNMFNEERWWGFGMQWHQLDHASNLFAPSSRQITTPTPHQSIFTGRMLFLTPIQQCQSIHISQHSTSDVKCSPVPQPRFSASGTEAAKSPLRSYWWDYLSGSLLL